MAAVLLPTLEFVAVYIENIVIRCQSSEKCFHKVGILLGRLIEERLKLQVKKCELG